MTEGNGNGPKEPPESKRPNGPSVKMSRNLVSWLVLLGLAMLLVALLQKAMPSSKEISISEFDALVRNDQVQLLRIKEDGVIELTQKGPAGPDGFTQFRVAYPREAIDNAFLKEMVEAVRKGGGDIKYEKQNQFVLLLVSMLPWILIFGFIWFFIFRQLRGASGPGGMLGNFGRSRHRVTHKEHTNITFADVAGIEEAKDEVQEIIEFLKAPKKFQRLGGRIPRGILLVGAPGCGKTLLAKAIAG
ncbi:MAG: ATP-dependent metallopeptidase FtsH/Yme1/Tma family protein, partial [Planctomycetota bacterium]